MLPVICHDGVRKKLFDKKSSKKFKGAFCTVVQKLLSNSNLQLNHAQKELGQKYLDKFLYEINSIKGYADNSKKKNLLEVSLEEEKKFLPQTPVTILR